jgi:peptide-methionine (S)-S-oxide reductase
MAELQRVLPKPVVTELTSLSNYSAAEAYHQDYFDNNPHQGYCAFVVAPKVQKFVQTFADKVRHG